MADLGARTYTEASAAAVVRQVLSAILHAHQKGICHRDLKFENILWESEADDAQIKVGTDSRWVRCGAWVVRRVTWLFSPSLPPSPSPALSPPTAQILLNFTLSPHLQTAAASS